VLAAEGKIDYPLFFFSNVGDDSEHPATLAYVRDVAIPYAAANGIELVELSGASTLLESLKRRERIVFIPMRMANGALGRRGCTGDYKIKRLATELRRRGATAAHPATLALGISLDEYHRMRTESGFSWERLAYPLIDIRLSRADCVAVIERAGLPVPPKSSCWFCPFKSLGEWRRMRFEEPALFEASADLEAMLNTRRAALGRDPVWLTRRLIPLRQAVGTAEQLGLFDVPSCDIGGYCMA
jgi:hypothetical protein